MFINYLKVALRNLWKNKGYTAINIGGLVIGLTGFIMLLLYVDYEYSYDHWDPQLKDIYQVNEKKSISANNEDKWGVNCDTRIAPLLKNNLPGVGAVTRVNGPFDFPISIITEGKSFLENGQLLRDSDSSFFSVFPYRFIAGNQKYALDKTHSMVITDSLARKWFGTVHVIGRSVRMKRWNTDPGTVYEITGIVKKPPSPTSISFDGIYNSGLLDSISTNPQVTYSANIYVKLNTHSSDRVLAKQVNEIYKTSFAGLLKKGHTSLSEYITSGKQYGIRLIPIQEAHLHPLNSKSVMSRLTPVLALSVLLLLIAIINFANLSTAMAVDRAKEVGMRKVMGAHRRSLVFQFMTEAALQCILALILALVLVELTLPSFNQLLDTSLSGWLFHHSIKWIWWQLILIVGITILLSGGYPAFFLSSYDPVKVLKGKLSHGAGGIRIRDVLIIIQFLIAAGFMVSIGIIHKQVNYMTHTDLGFQTSGLINLNTVYNKKLAARLKTIPGVLGIGTTTQIMGDPYDFMQKVKYRGEYITMNLASISIGTLKAMDVHLLEGRLLSPQYSKDSVNNIIVNESAARLLGGRAVGKTIYENDSLPKHIVGVIADYHYEGFDKKIIPTFYSFLHGSGPMAVTSNLLVRIDANQFQTAISGIKKIWKGLYPGFPVHYTFVEERFHQVIADDIRFRKIVTAFTLLSLVLSLVGIFALSAFITTNRAKEIGIRRVLGASIPDILKMLNQKFILMVVVANIIAWPITYILAKKWLNGFAYRVEIPVWPFVIATVLSIVLTIITVSVQAWRTARSNPIDVLKYE